MSAFSNYLENVYAAHIGSDTIPAAEDTYIALYTDVVNDAGTGTEVSGGAYARQLVNQDGATGVYWTVTLNVIDNQSELAFPQATANWGTIVSFAVMDAVAAGNQLFHGLLGSNPFFAVGLNTGDIIHSVAHGRSNDDKVVFETIEGGGALPGGITEGTEYWVVNSAADNFQISTTQGGGALPITADGMARTYLSQQRTVNTNDTFKFPAGDLNITIR